MPWPRGVAFSGAAPVAESFEIGPMIVLERRDPGREHPRAGLNEARAGVRGWKGRPANMKTTASAVQP